MAKPSSFIKLNRNILNWRWYQDANVSRVFLHILLNANYEESDYQNVHIERGEWAVTLGTFEKDLKLTKQQVRTALDKLELTGEITRKKHNKFLVITVVCYDLYQGTTTQKTTHNQHANNTQITRKQHHQKKEIKKEIKKEYNNSNELFPQSDFTNLPALPLIDGTEYAVSASEVENYKALYPAVDVEQQVRAMCGWLDANPKNRKTRAGIKRFINSWLSKEQNRAPRARDGTVPDSGETLEELIEKYRTSSRGDLGSSEHPHPSATLTPSPSEEGKA